MLKFNRAAGNTYLSAADNAALTYPTTDWAIGFIMSLDGVVDGDNPQYIVSNGPYQSAGSLNLTYQTTASTTMANKVALYVGTDPGQVGTSNAYLSGTRLWVLQSSGGQLTLRSCPILGSAPADGSAVVSEFSVAAPGELNGQSGMFIGARADAAAARMLDQSLGRFFRVGQALSNLQMAELAYGKTLADLSITPQTYIGMADSNDTANTGSNGITFTKSGSPATSAEPSYGYTGAVADGVSLENYAGGRVFQRSGASATLPITGTYTGTQPSSVEVIVYHTNGTLVQDWTAVSGLSVSGGSFTGTLSVPQGGMYRRQARTKDAGGIVLATDTLSSNSFGVGDLWATIGSSSAEKWFDSSSGTGHTPDGRNSVYDEVSGWRPMTATGSASLIADPIIAAAGVPIGFVDMGEGGTTLAQWLNEAGAQWTKLQSAVTTVGGKLTGVISSMGSNDAAQSIVTSMASHKTNLETLVTRLRAMTGVADMHVLISGTNRRADGPTEQYDWVREAETQAGGNLNTLHVNTIDLELSGDGVHLTAAGFDACCQRLGYVLGRLYSAGAYARGPKITAFNYTVGGTGVDVLLEQRSGTDFTPTTGITGFEASDGGGALTISSAVRVDASKIHLEFNRAINGTPVVTYLKGKQPNTAAAVKDNGSVPLAMDIELSLASTQVQVTNPPPTGNQFMAIPNKPAGPYALDTSNPLAAGFTVYMMDVDQPDPLLAPAAVGMTREQGFYRTHGNVSLKTDDPHGVGLYKPAGSPDDYIVISDNGSLDTIDPDAYNIPFTKIFVFRPSTISGVLFTTAGRDSADFNYSAGAQLIRYENGNVQMLKSNQVYMGGTENVPVVANDVLAVAVTYDGSTLQFAANGVDCGTVNNSQSGWNINKVWLGSGAQGDSQDAQTWFMMAHSNDVKSMSALQSLTANPYQLVGLKATGEPPPSDTTKPTLVTHSTNTAGDTLTLNFNEVIAGYSSLSANMFAITNSHSVSAMSVVGQNAELTLDPPLAPGEQANLTFTAPAAGSGYGIKDAAGNAADSFTISPITNNAVANPTGKPSLPGFILMTIGPDSWTDFKTESELEAWVNGTDCRNLANPVMVWNYFDRELNFSGKQIGPLGSDRNKYITFKPAPGRAYWELEPDSADGSWGTLGDTIEVSGMTSWLTGMKFEGWRIHTPANFTDGATWRLRRNGWNQSGSESGMKYCKFLNESTRATFETGEYGNYTMIEDCILLEMHPSMNAKISTGGGGEMYRSTVYRANASSTNPSLEGFGEVHSCVFYNCGAEPYLGGGNRSNNYSNKPTTSAGCTYVSQTMFESGVRPAAGTAIIGGGGALAVSTNDANGNNRGLNPDAGAVQRTPALPLAKGTLTKYEVDGSSLLVEIDTTGQVDSATISISPANSTSGAVSMGPFQMTLGAGTAAYDIDDIVPGDYLCTVLLSNPGGAQAVPGTSQFSIIGVGGGTEDPGTIEPATAVTLLNAITTATAGVASAPMRVGLNGSRSGVVTVGLSDGSGGTFEPGSPQIVNGESVTFTYTPATGGTKTITFTNDAGLVSPNSFTVNVAAAQLPAPVVTISSALQSILMGSRATLSGSLDFKGDAAGAVELYYEPIPSGTNVKFTGTISVTGNTWTAQWQNLPVGEFRLRVRVIANGQTVEAVTGTLRIVGSTGVVNVPIA